jgi:hypothetical protein
MDIDPEPKLDHTQRPSRSVVHKAVRNYIVNELGISRAAVKGMIEPLVKAAVADLMGMNYDTSGIGRKWVHDLIAETIRAAIKLAVIDAVRQCLTHHTKVTVDVVIPRPVDDGARTAGLIKLP